MAKSQSAWKKYLLASTVVMFGATVGWGTALAQAQTTQGGGGQTTQGGGGQTTQGGGGQQGQQQAGGGGGSSGGGGGTQQAVDPGVRGGTPGAGGPISGLTTNELNFFNAAETRFENVDAVPNGLGPAFNGNSCAQCHAAPAVGGTSPSTNPEVALATLDGATNVVPSFVTANGPVREARFVNNPDGTPDGGVHDLFTIAGRSDAPGCNMAQPNFAAQLAANNAIFRIPTPLFGLGLVENTSDAALQSDFSSTAQQRSSLGISGNFNLSGNTGNITRFGWKAQNPSLLVFAAEAYDVEMGVTNDGFPEERLNPPASCETNPLPEDTTNLTDSPPASNSPASDYSSDIVNFAAFMRMTAPPTPATQGTPTASSTTSSSTTTSPTSTSSTSTSPTSTSSTSTSSTSASSASTPSTSTSSTSTTQVASADQTSVLSTAAGTPSTSSAGSNGSTTGSTVAADASQGAQVFQNVGCAACHTTTMTSGNSEIGAAETNVTFNPFSDFALHDMGQGLADGVSQGAATGQQFRTAPLWGVGQRIFFLHDGRTDNLVTAIEDHASSGSEANAVIQNFNMLSMANQQALIDFLRSL